MRRVDYEAFYHSDLDTWVKKQDKNLVIGITDWAQSVIGNITALHDLPENGKELIQNMLLCEIESDKTTSEILIPLGGKVIAINDALNHFPNLLNEDCYDRGWVLKISSSNISQLDQFMSAYQYEQAISSFFKKS